MSKRYVLFAALPYAYSILRPIQTEIIKRGGEVAWYLEAGCEDLLHPDEKKLNTVEELVAYKPDATLTPGNLKKYQRRHPVPPDRRLALAG